MAIQCIFNRCFVLFSSDKKRKLETARGPKQQKKFKKTKDLKQKRKKWLKSQSVNELEWASAGSVLKKPWSPLKQETILEGRKILRGIFQVLVLWEEQGSSVCVKIFLWRVTAACEWGTGMPWNDEGAWAAPKFPFQEGRCVKFLHLNGSVVH